MKIENVDQRSDCARDHLAKSKDLSEKKVTIQHI